MDSNLTLPGGLSLNDGDMAVSWKKFKQRIELYMIASGYAEKEEKIKCSLFLHLIGEEALDVYNTFEIPTEDANKLDVLYTKFEEYCVPQKNVTYERHIFFSRHQLEDEPVDKWVTELKRLAQSCEFGALRDELVKDAITLGINDSTVKGRLLREKDLTLTKAKEICKIAESSKAHLKQIGSRDTAPLSVDAARVNRPGYNSSGQNSSGYKPPNANDNSAPSQPCRFCARHHKPRECPAYGKSCNKCNGRNHFANACRKPPNTTNLSANAVDVQQQPAKRDTFYMGAVGLHKRSVGKWLADVKLEDTVISVKIDTGADINVIPQTKLRAVAPRAILQPFLHKLEGVGNLSVPVLGETSLRVSYNATTTQPERFVVVPDEAHKDILLTGDLCERLLLVSRNVLAVTETPSELQQLAIRFNDIFDGLGTSHQAYKPKVDNNVRPVVKPCRRIPHAMMTPLKNELDKMETSGVIVKVVEPTDWVSQLVVGIKKNGELRICLDPQALNAALCREHYHMPMIEDLMDNLSGTTVFSNLI
jgi:hypothetical protein